jgi:hypothetical protein
MKDWKKKLSMPVEKIELGLASPRREGAADNGSAGGVGGDSTEDSGDSDSDDNEALLREHEAQLEQTSPENSIHADYLKVRGIFMTDACSWLRGLRMLFVIRPRSILSSRASSRDFAAKPSSLPPPLPPSLPPYLKVLGKTLIYTGMRKYELDDRVSGVK